METADLSENVEETDKDPNPAQEGGQDAAQDLQEKAAVFDPPLTNEPFYKLCIALSSKCEDTP